MDELALQILEEMVAKDEAGRAIIGAPSLYRNLERYFWNNDIKKEVFKEAVKALHYDLLIDFEDPNQLDVAVLRLTEEGLSLYRAKTRKLFL